jgi:hypothetical protein
VHCFLLGNFISAFLIFLSLSSTTLKELFQFSMEKEDFEKTIRYFIWEGRENYLNRRNMKAAIDRAKGESDAKDFDLPEWERFLHVVRSFLDAPESLASLPFLIKEIAFRAMTTRRRDPDEHLRGLFEANNRARQFIFATTTYLVSRVLVSGTAWPSADRRILESKSRWVCSRKPKVWSVALKSVPEIDSIC